MTEPTYRMTASGEIEVGSPDGGLVFAKPLDDFPIKGIYMTWSQGLIYLRRIERDAVMGDARGQVQHVTRCQLDFLVGIKILHDGEVEAGYQGRIFNPVISVLPFSQALYL